MLLLLAVFALAGCARGGYMDVYGWIDIDNEHGHADFVVNRRDWHLFNIDPQRASRTFELRLSIRNVDEVLSILGVSLGERDAVNVSEVSVRLRRVWPFRQSIQIDEILQFDEERVAHIKRVMVDYVYLANLMHLRTVGHIYEGGYFLNFSVDEIISSDLLYVNDEFRHFTHADIRLSGDATVFGTLTVPSDVNSRIYFAVVERHFRHLPHLHDFRHMRGRQFWYRGFIYYITNEDFVLDGVGLCRDEIYADPELRLVSVEMYVTISNLRLLHRSRDEITISGLRVVEVE